MASQSRQPADLCRYVSKSTCPTLIMPQSFGIGSRPTRTKFEMRIVEMIIIGSLQTFPQESNELQIDSIGKLVRIASPTTRLFFHQRFAKTCRSLVLQSRWRLSSRAGTSFMRNHQRNYCRWHSRPITAQSMLTRGDTD